MTALIAFLAIMALAAWVIFVGAHMKSSRHG